MAAKKYSSKTSGKKEKESSYKVQNIVAITSLGKPIPLTKLARKQANTEYNPETFPGLVLRIQEPKSAVLVFSSVPFVSKSIDGGLGIDFAFIMAPLDPLHPLLEAIVTPLGISSVVLDRSISASPST